MPFHLAAALLASLGAAPLLALSARRELGLAFPLGLGLAAGILAMAVFILTRAGLELSSAGFAALSCLTCALIAETDRRHYLIPDLLVALLLALSVLAPYAPDWRTQLLGAAASGGLLLAVRQGFYLLRGAHGLGLGDVKLAAVIGAMLGPRDAFMAIAVAAIVTAVLFRSVSASAPQAAGARAAPFGLGLAAAAAVSILIRAWGSP